MFSKFDSNFNTYHNSNSNSKMPDISSNINHDSSGKLTGFTANANWESTHLNANYSPNNSSLFGQHTRQMSPDITLTANGGISTNGNMSGSICISKKW